MTRPSTGTSAGPGREVDPTFPVGATLERPSTDLSGTTGRCHGGPIAISSGRDVVGPAVEAPTPPTLVSFYAELLGWPIVPEDRGRL